MEPPSRQLTELLTRLRLATPRDLRRCRPLVRRLARDLPTFDSVWVDALTQNRVLTPFQARLIGSEAPGRLEVGPCILVDEWERDGCWTLCLARHRITRRKCLLTYVNIAADLLPRAQGRVRDLLSDLRGLSHPSIVVPQGCDELDGRLVVISPYITGPTLQQLLVRRGRFPIAVVTEIGRQLLEALATLEGRDVVHGDIRLRSLRLTSRGQVVLLNPGILPAAGSRVSFHDPLPPDAYDGTAPELISSGRTATLQSDLYALGCLLWQLLAGRPPFPTGDALSKLAAHQSRSIDDVRRWRPDTPGEMAALICRLTQKDPGLRPSGPRDAAETLRRGSRGRRSALATFHASFGVVAPRHGDAHRSASRFPWPVAATLLIVLSGLSLSLLDVGARNELLRLANHLARTEAIPSAPAGTASATTSTARQGTLLPFPEPIDGVIELDTDGPYMAGEVRTNRPLTIRAAAGASPIILVGERPLRIFAQSLQLMDMRFAVRHDGPTHDVQASPAVLLDVQAQQLAVDHCEFVRPPADGQACAIAWSIADEADANGGRLVVRNTWFSGSGGAVELQCVPRVVGFDNCLSEGSGCLVRFGSRRGSSPLRIHLRHTTLRNVGAVLQWTTDAAAESLQPALIVVENSIFALQDGAGMLDFQGGPPVGWERLLQVTGEGSLLLPRTPLATAQGAPIDSERLRVEGLMIDEFEFAGDASGPQTSFVVATQAPRSTQVPPGIDPARLSRPAVPLVRQASGEAPRTGFQTLRPGG